MVNKDDGKQATSKPRQSAHYLKKKKKEEEPSNRIEPLHDNLDEYFGPSQSQNSQETVNVVPVDTPKKSEEAKSKEDPDNSNHQSIDESSKPL